MDEQLDKGLAALKAERPDARLSGLETRVWARIAEARTTRAAGWLVAPAGAAAIAGALLIGAATGGLAASAMANEPHEISVFSTNAALAPSTLLAFDE